MVSRLIVGLAEHLDVVLGLVARENLLEQGQGLLLSSQQPGGLAGSRLELEIILSLSQDGNLTGDSGLRLREAWARRGKTIELPRLWG